MKSLVDVIADPGQEEYTPNGTPLKTRQLLHAMVEHEVFNALDVRRRNLIGVYYSSEVTLQQLAPQAGVTTRERVRQLIRSGMRLMYQALPEDVQARYSLGDVVLLKNRTMQMARAQR